MSDAALGSVAGTPKPRAALTERAGARASALSAFVSTNAADLVALTLMAAAVTTFVTALSRSYAHVSARLATLAALPAGIGTAAYLVGTLAPCVLMLLTAKAVALSMRPGAQARGTRGPVVAALLVCLALVVGSLALGTPPASALSGEAAVALRLALATSLSPAAAGAALCLATVIALTASGRRER